MSAGRNVLVLHSSDEAYGADRILLELVRGLTARGWRFTVLLPDDVPPGWLSARLAEHGTVVVRMDLAVARRRHLRPARLPWYARSLLVARGRVRREVRRSAAAIVHVNTSALLVGALVGRPGGARLVWHVHEIVLRPRLMAWLFRTIPTLAADRVIAVSDAVRAHLGPAALARSRVVTVRNGIPGRERRPHPAVPAAGPVVAYVGRLNRWKGYEVFLDAAARVARRNRLAAFVVAGDPPPGEEWRARDAELRAEAIRDRVTLLGVVDDGSSVFEAADIAVVPSTWPDPLPTVVLEAMRAGCAVVASRHGGAPEMIEHERSGLLVTPGDAEELADAILRLLDDPDLRRSLGDAARERVASRFSVARMLDEVEALYVQVGR